jgi:hypothetical protein
MLGGDIAESNDGDSGCPDDALSHAFQKYPYGGSGVEGAIPDAVR